MAKACDWCPINNCFVCEGHCGLCADHEGEDLTDDKTPADN